MRNRGKKESQYRLLFEAMADSFALCEIITDTAGKPVDYRIIDANSAYEKFIGLPRAQIVGRLRSQIPVPLTPASFQRYAKVALTGKPVEFTNYNTALGKHYKVRVYSPAPRRFATIFTDITKGVEMESGLRAAEEKARLIVANAPAMIYEIDLAGTYFISVNDAMCSMLGYTREELMKMRPADLLDGPSRKLFAERIRKKLAGEDISKAAEYHGRTKENREMFVSVKTTFIEKDGKPATALVVAHDITERKKAEEAVKVREEQFSKAFYSAPVGTCLFKMDDMVLADANDIFFEMIGMNRSEAIGRRNDKAGWIRGIGERNFFQKELAEAGVFRDKEIKIYHKNGNYHDVIASGQALDIGGNKFVLGMMVDITDRKNTEKEITKLASFPKLNPNPVIEINLGGKIIYFNDAAARIAEEEGGKRGVRAFLPQKFAKITAGLKNDTTSNITRKEVNVGSRVFKESVHFLKDMNVVRVYAFDITDRKHMEMQLNKLNRTLWALSSSNQALLHADDETELLQKVCKIIVEDCGHAMVWIGYARNDPAKSVTPEAYAGFEKGYLEKLNVTWADNERGQGTTGTAIRTGKSQQCRNMRMDPRFKPWREDSLRRGYASSLSLPLLHDGKSLGAITIYSTKANGFPDESEILLLSELADNLAYGIVSLRLRQETQRAQEKLRETKEYLDNLLNYANAPIIVWDPEFRITRFNRAAEMLLGFKSKGVLGKKIDILFPKTGKETFFKYLRETLEGRRWQTVEVPMRRRDGVIRNVIWSSAAIFDNRGEKVMATIAQGQDITEEKKAKTTLTARSKELARMVGDLKKLQLAVEDASDIIFVIDTEGRIISANKAVENLLGHKPKNVVGKSLAIFDHNADEEFYRRIFEEVRRIKKPFSREVVNIRKNGQKAVFELYISPVTDAHGKVVSFIGIERDCTEAKAIDRAKTEFISMASHQLRTPLSTLSLTAQMILSGAIGSVDSAARRHIQEILNIADQMAAMVELLLNVSRVEMGKLTIDPQPLKIKEFVKEGIGRILPQAQKKKIEVRSRVAAGLPVISADHKVLDIALDNFLSNAVKYTPDGGRVTVTVSKSDAEIIFTVTDTGIGIPKNQMPLLFTKMFRANNVGSIKGFGMGLNMVKHIMKQSGGRAWFSSRNKEGSEFSIAVPLTGMKRKDVRLES